MKKIKLILVIIVISLFGLTGCTTNKTDSNHKIINLDIGEDLVINAENVDEKAVFYNYLADDVTIQTFAVKATDDTLRIAFNTCGACNPSPEAYFIQEGDYFICQNCKTKFHRDEVGLTNDGGCSPIAILDENKEINDNTTTIKGDFILTYKNKFTKINTYKNLEDR